MPLLALIIPCYNEANRLDVNAFSKFAKENNSVYLYFINDGSTDETGEKLYSILYSNPKQVKIITLKKNAGKGNAIQAGFLKTLDFHFEFTAYLDADLSTPISELTRLLNLIENNEQIIIASRIKKANSIIKRAYFRHIIGRVIATIIDLRFKLGIYDTQCGAKIFPTNFVRIAFQKPFLTSWFFDIEIFLRLKKHYNEVQIKEEPLLVWNDISKSKLSIFSSIEVCKQLFILLKNY